MVADKTLKSKVFFVSQPQVKESVRLRISWFLPFLPALLLAPNLALAGLEMNEIRALARKHSASLKAKEMEARALEHDLSFKGKWSNPQLLGQIGSLRSGGAQGSTLELTLTQAVPLTNKHSLKRELAEKALEGQQQQQDFFRNWVEHQALLSAWKARIQLALFAHGIERAERIRLIERYLATQPRVSVRQRVELSVVSSVVLRLLRQQDQKKFELTRAEDDLSYWLGRKVSAQEIVGGIPPEAKIRIPPEGSHTRDPEWQQANLQLESSRIEATLASRERWPDLVLGGGYRVERVAPINQFTYALIGLTLPLWDTGFSRRDSADARVRRAEFELEDTERRIRLKHEKLLEQARFELQQVKRFPTSLIQVQERAILEAERGFKQRLLDVGTFLQAETETHEVLDQIYLSWQNYLESLSPLLLMSGEPLIWEQP